MLTHETYHRKVQLGASRRRLEDAHKLLDQQRWVGAMYLGGYVVECALVALICYQERCSDFRNTQAFQFVQGSKIHNLSQLIGANSAQKIRMAIDQDRTGRLKADWDYVAGNWQYEKLRYYDKGVFHLS